MPLVGITRNTMTRCLWLVAASTVFPGCSDPAAPRVLRVTADPATDAQTARTGTALPHPLAVLVALGNGPVAGVRVTWRASAGSVAASSITDADGRASASWVLGEEPGPMTVSTGVEGAEGSPVTFTATAVAAPLTPSASSTGQTGVVGTALPLPLRVKARSEDGAPMAGVIVHWQARDGRVAPSESTSDGEGFAETRWTLDTLPGAFTVYASIAGVEHSTVSFDASALPGAAVAIAASSGSGQTYPANHPPETPLVAVVTDRYGNRVGRQPVEWTIRSGPATLLQSGGVTDAAGESTALIGPSLAMGSSIVRAALPDAGVSTDFHLTIARPAAEVVLHTGGFLAGGPFAFVSSQNGSRSPAVDTIPAGRTITWLLEFDYDLHGVAPVGTPMFQGGDFPWTGQPAITARFVTPGTYQYADPYHPSVTGIVVVQ